MNKTVKYALSGAAAGSANGLFGAGGGMILVPLLTRWAGLEDKKAFATSIAIIAPMCLTSILLYWYQGQLDLASALPYLVGGLFGGLLGGTLFRRMSPQLLHKLLGIFILYGGIRSVIC